MGAPAAGDAVRRAHAHRRQRSRRLQVHRRRSCSTPSRPPARARSCSRCTSPTAIPPPTTTCSRPRRRPADGSSPSAASRRATTPSPRSAAAWPPARAASSCIRARSCSASTSPPCATIVALADEERLPILIHAGRGIPALGAHVLEFASEFPRARFILAHCAVCDLAWIWQRMREYPNVFVDTSWFSTADQLAVYSLIPPGQILFATDIPFGTSAADRDRVAALRRCRRG